MSDNSKPIVPPQSHAGRAITRGVVKGAVELIPGASLLTNILAVTHPSIEDVDRKRWEEEMTRRSNEQDAAIARVVGAFLNMKRANDAQQLSFVRGGMITTLEAITRDGLTPELQAELSGKLEVTAKDVEELLEGLDAALTGMSDNERHNQFAEILHETVFGSFGKSSIRRDIQKLFQLNDSPIELQKKRAQGICDGIDRFNSGLRRLSNYATASLDP